MDPAMMEMFLAIAETRSISRAAERMYLSQSTLSNRLSALEAEVGARLVHRAQGRRHLTLTPKGEEFVTFAGRYASLMKDIDTWKRSEPRYPLRVACPASLNAYVLPPLFRRVAEGGHPLTLHIMTHWNHTIYAMMESFELDIGLVTRHFPAANIVTAPVFSEQMVLISHPEHAAYGEEIHPAALKVRDEIHVDWGLDFQLWHDRWWPPGDAMDFTVDTPALIHAFIARPGAWSIVPLTVARELARLGPLQIAGLTEPVPNRTVYRLSHRTPKPGSERALRVFQRELEAFLSGHADLL